MKQLSDINEGVFGDILKREHGGEERMENILHPADEEELYNMITDIKKAKGGEYLDLRHIDVSQIKRMTSLFAWFNPNLKVVDVTGWDTSKVDNMAFMFYRCTELEEIIGIENWNVESLTSAECMFRDCRSLKSLDLSKWNLKNLSFAGNIFLGVKPENIEGIDKFKKHEYKHNLINNKK